MNQDVTAPVTVRGMKISNSLTDATAEFALAEHARVALNNLRLSELAGLSRRPLIRDLPQLRSVKSAAYAAVSGFNDIFAVYAAAALLGEPSSITSGRLALHGITGAGCSFRETTTIAIDQSGSPRAEPPGTTLGRFIRALGEWKGLLAPDHLDAMVHHVERLLSDQEELDEDGITPTSSSFDDLLSFLSNRPWDKAPAVGLNRRGQFSASWGRRHPRTDVTLSFLGEGSIKWYVYGLGRKGNGSATGTSDRLDLAGILSRLGCDNWMAR